MTEAKSKHWDSVYATKSPDQVSWFREHLERSLSFVESSGVPLDARIIDVGGGASSFVDDLLVRGYTNLTVLDISEVALKVAKSRLGERAANVTWVCADITEVDLGASVFDFWHDRAVYHFLTLPEQREKYVSTMRRALRPGGNVVIGTFGPNGPKQCSALDVLRLSGDAIHAELGAAFSKVATDTEVHQTPWGSSQEFAYCHCRLLDGAANRD